jgi:hypothetical protein
MKKELVDTLYSKYPEILSSLQREITVEDGWYNLINSLCNMIQFYLRQNSEVTFKAIQIKEKIGGLRFYGTGKDDYISGAIELAVELSHSICEICGSPGTCGSHDSGSIKTLCAAHKINLKGK